MHSIAALNQMSQAEFVAVCGAVFEDTPEIAAQVWQDRPFTDVTDLHQKMMAIVAQMNSTAQMALICAHPDLGSRVQMATASVQEQTGAGLNQLSTAEYERFQQLNQQYRDRFSFPFIIAVRHHTKASILAAFEQRLRHTPEAEKQQALAQIGEIARLRLLNIVTANGL